MPCGQSEHTAALAGAKVPGEQGAQPKMEGKYPALQGRAEAVGVTLGVGVGVVESNGEGVCEENEFVALTEGWAPRDNEGVGVGVGVVEGDEPPEGVIEIDGVADGGWKSEKKPL